MKQLFLLFPLILFANESNLTQENNTTASYEKEDAGMLYLKNACNSCHGIYAEGIGSAPKLQGQAEDVLLRRLKDLQQGKTRTAFGGIMISFAQALDENQTKAMAAYLSTIKIDENEERYDEPFSPSGDGSS